MPLQTGHVTDHHQKAMSGDGRKSSGRDNDEATMRCNLVMFSDGTKTNNVN